MIKPNEVANASWNYREWLERKTESELQYIETFVSPLFMSYQLFQLHLVAAYE